MSAETDLTLYAVNPALETLRDELTKALAVPLEYCILNMAATDARRHSDHVADEDINDHEGCKASQSILAPLLLTIISARHAEHDYPFELLAHLSLLEPTHTLGVIERTKGPS